MTSQNDSQPQDQTLPEGASGDDSAPEYVPTPSDLRWLFEYGNSKIAPHVLRPSLNKKAMAELLEAIAQLDALKLSRLLDNKKDEDK